MCFILWSYVLWHHIVWYMKLQIYRFLHNPVHIWYRCPEAWYSDPGLRSAMADSSRCTSGNFWPVSVECSVHPNETISHLKISVPGHDLGQWACNSWCFKGAMIDHEDEGTMLLRNIRKLNTQWHSITSWMTCIFSNTDVRPSNVTSHTGR